MLLNHQYVRASGRSSLGVVTLGAASSFLAAVNGAITCATTAARVSGTNSEHGPGKGLRASASED